MAGIMPERVTKMPQDAANRQVALPRKHTLETGQGLAAFKTCTQAFIGPMRFGQK